MERYGYLFGTQFEGEASKYVTIAKSADVDKFLAKLGSVNHTATVELVRSFLGDIVQHGGYFSQLANERPVAVRFAPLALRSQPGMPKSLKNIYAMCINGFENVLGDRVGKYAHLILMDPEGFYNSEGYTYLDRIFGTPLTSWQDIQAYKDKAKWIPPDFCKAMCSKALPAMNPRDREAVITAVQGIFTKKTVIIRLEKNYSFNRRAWELLLQIYSLFTPQQAETFGFSTYEDPNNIDKLVSKTAIRVFVLPAEAELDKVNKRNTVIIDLAAGNMNKGSLDAEKVDELKDAIDAWYHEEWQQRQRLMETIFSNVRVFDDKTYVQLTREYRNDSFVTWLASGKYKGTCASLEAVKEKYDSFPICQKLPWAHERFCEIAESMLTAPLKLSDLAAQALVEAMYNPDEEMAQTYADLFFFAERLGVVETVPAAQKVGNYIQKRDFADFSEKIAQANRERDEAITAEKAETERVREETRLTMEKAKQECEAAIATEKNKTKQVKEKSRRDLEEAQKKFDAAIATEQDKIKQVEEQSRQDLEEAQKKFDEEIAAEKKKTEQVREVSRLQLENAQNEYDRLISEEQTNTLRARRETAEAKDRIADQEKKIDDLKQSLESAKENYESLSTHKTNLEQKLKDEAERYRKLEKAKQDSDQEVSAAKAEIDALKDEKQRITQDAEDRVAEVEQKKWDVEQEVNRVRRELDGIKSSGIYKPDKKMLIATAGIGLAVALLVGGAAFTIWHLTRNSREPAKDPTVPFETIVDIADPTSESTDPTATTMTESTEPPSNLEIPYMDYEPTITEQLLMEEIPEIKYVVTEELNSLIPDLKAVGEYVPASIFLLTEEEMKSEMLNHYAVLYVHAEQDSQEQTEASAAENQQAGEMGSTQPTEETAPTSASEPEKTGAYLAGDEALPLELIVPDMAGARLVLVSDRYILALYGDHMDAVTVLNIFAKLVPEEADVSLGWYIDDEATDIAALMAALLEDDQCWRSITAVSENEADLAEGQKLLNTEETPILCLQCGETFVYLFENVFSAQAETLASEWRNAGYRAQAERKLVAVEVHEPQDLPM